MLPRMTCQLLFSLTQDSQCCCRKGFCQQGELAGRCGVALFPVGVNKQECCCKSKQQQWLSGCFVNPSMNEEWKLVLEVSAFSPRSRQRRLEAGWLISVSFPSFSSAAGEAARLEVRRRTPARLCGSAAPARLLEHQL